MANCIDVKDEQSAFRQMFACTREAQDPAIKFRQMVQDVVGAYNDIESAPKVKR
jgi:hypothetical protein